VKRSVHHKIACSSQACELCLVTEGKMIGTERLAATQKEEGAKRCRKKPPRAMKTRTGDSAVYGFSTMSAFRVEMAAATSFCSFSGTLNFVNVATRCLTAMFQSSSVMPSPLCAVFISRPM
jgi:hypothetical protein